MNPSSYRFTLDLHSTQSQISLPVTLGDTARVFYISLADGGLPYIIADGCLAMLSVKRPSGTHLEAFCAIESNTTIKYDFEQNPNTAVEDGIHDCSLTLYNAEGREISSPRFTMIVSSRVVNKDDINITTEDQSAISAILAVEANRQLAEEGRVTAEAGRVTAEEGRVSADEARKTALEEALARVNALYDGVTRITFVELTAAAWEGSESPYAQVIDIPGVTENTRVDLQPTVEQLTTFRQKEVAFTTANIGGEITVYAIGDKPQNDYVIQASLTEVIV